MNRVFSINQGYKVNKRACAARQGDSVPLRVLTNEPVTCRRALWATRQELGDDGPSWLLSLSLSQSLLLSDSIRAAAEDICRAGMGSNDTSYVRVIQYTSNS